MMAQGLLEEARGLLPHRGLNALKTVGYKELFAYFDGLCSLDEAVKHIQFNTHNTPVNNSLVSSRPRLPLVQPRRPPGIKAFL
jgi:hypothetical protein